MSQYTTVTVDLRAGECIDAVAPLPLQPFIPTPQWSSFGAKINAALLQLGNATQCQSTIFCGSILGVLLFVAGGFLIVNTGETFPQALLIIFGLVIFIGSPITALSMMSEATRKFVDDVKQISGNANFRDVTVQYKQTTTIDNDQRHNISHHLEFICGVHSPTSIVAVPALAVAVPVSASSTKERLRELEDLKEYLTADEYAEKRRDILASMV
jgi:hypothetical protein